MSETDVASDEIEKSIFVLHPQLFLSLKEFEIIDESGYRRIFCIFLPLLKRFNNLEKLSIKSQDSNINIILEECLPNMPYLREFYLNSKAPRSEGRFQIINNIVENLEKLWIASELVKEASNILNRKVQIFEI